MELSQGTTRRRALAGAALCILAGGATAQAQDADIRGQTVTERLRPLYGSEGTRVGAFLVRPSAQISLVSDSNVYSRDTAVQDDLLTILQARVRATSIWSRHQLNAEAFVRSTQFSDLDTEDNDEFGGNANVRLDLIRPLTVRAGAGFERRTVSRADPEEAGRLAPQQVDIGGADASVTYGENVFILRLSGSVDDYDHRDALDRQRDRTESEVALRGAYVASPSLQIFAEPYLIERDFDLAVDLSGRNRDSSVRGVRAGATYDLTGLLTGETSVGWFSAEFDDPAFADEDGFGVRSALDWSVTALTTLSFEAVRENQVTNIAGASSRDRLELSLGVEHELLRNLLLAAEVSYIEDDFADLNRSDDTFRISAGGEYLINDYLSLSLTYRHVERSSDVPTVEFDRNEVLATLRARL